MASDFNKPVSTDNYLDLLTTIRDNQKALAKMFDGETVSNTPTGSIRWSTENGRLEKYNGSTWDALLPVATTSSHGLMSSADKTKLDGVAASANNYAHPTSDGNKHVPATSTTNGRKGLIAGDTAGVFSWSDAMFSFELASVSTATTIAATHIGKMLRVTSAVALSVPTPTSLGLRNGESFVVVASVDNIAINRISSTFAGSTGNVDLILSAHEYVQLTVAAANTWQIIIFPTVSTAAETIAGTLDRKYTTPAGVKTAIDAAAYVHPTSDGNKHVPATGTTNNGKVLTAGATAGSMSWATLPEGVPPGLVAFYPKTTAPTGWLKANGAAISRSTYSALFAAIGTAFGAGDGSTTFNIPDLRGEFIRGLDDGRGVDTGRTLSSTSQGNQNKSHSHTGTAASAGTHAHSIATRVASGDGGTEVGSTYGAAGGTYATASAGTHTHTVTTVADGGTETRPRNIALLACIKY